MEHRLARFQELHQNLWFSVMNWVLDELRMRPSERWRQLGSHGFYFDANRIPHPVFRYRDLW